MSRRSDIILLLSGIAAFCFFYAFFDAEEALACSLVLGVFLCVIETKPKDDRDKRFWLVLGILALVHIAVLMALRIPKLHFGLVALPFAMADALGIWCLMKWLERRHPSVHEPSSGE